MAKESLKHFLLVFDHKSASIQEIQEFGENTEVAVAAYSETERRYTHDQMIEVVLIGSDSLDTVKRTHANYFDGTVALSKYLIDL